MNKGFPIGSPFLFMCFVIERKVDIWILDSQHFERTESGEMSRGSLASLSLMNLY